MNTIVLDTSAISTLETFEVIQKAEKVIITSIVLRELNDLKGRTKNLELHNQIQKLLKECALDTKSEKYHVIDIYPKNDECHDETIARNAANIENAVVVTNDYGMCSFCKLYKVGYFLVMQEMKAQIILEDSDESETQDKNQENNESTYSTSAYILKRSPGTMSIICLMGTIEIMQNGKLQTTLKVNEKAEIFENDKIKITTELKTTNYIVKSNYNKKKLFLSPDYSINS